MEKRRRYNASPEKFTHRMRIKLVVLYVFALLAFVGLSYRLVNINRVSGQAYKKQVMSQQRADSRVIPFQRGDIVDRKGSKLAYSEKVYNLVIDAKQINSEEGIHRQVTLDSLQKCFPMLAIMVTLFSLSTIGETEIQ